jgi:dTDP-glucose 4,6-dehydratase|tara:strand:+ start:217 stop:1161 length:945 start_codon:yes stop_codon:yes gene_type:complete
LGGFIKYLITGGAGFIGSNLVNYLIDSSEKIIVVDNLITGNLENLENYKNNTKFEFYSHDIQNHFEINENIDYVIHLASCASPFAYSNYPINTLKSGSIGTINALGLAKKHNAKFFLASTSEIYGDPEISPQHEEYWGNVNTLGPRSMYDESKRFAESATQAYITSHGLKANIARIFNTYGPNMVFNDGRVVTNFIYQAINDKDITIYGDGTQTRSFSYIDDTINGIVKILNYKSPDVFNIGNDEEVTIKDLAKKIILLTGSKSKIKFLDLPQDDPKQRKPDLSKAEKLLDYTPSITLDEGLKKTIEWFLERYK